MSRLHTLTDIQLECAWAALRRAADGPPTLHGENAIRQWAEDVAALAQNALEESENATDGQSQT